MSKIIIDAFIDSLKTLPFLLLVYVGIELLESKYSNILLKKVEKAGTAGPAIGSLAGSLPQCGFSVITTALYVQRLVTMGTLIAAYIATSDEAIPILLSHSSQFKIILPLILTKIILAIIAGYSIDLLFFRKNRRIVAHINRFEQGECKHSHECALDEKGCCGHSYAAENKLVLKEIILHPIYHTLKIFAYIFITTVILNFIIWKIGMGNIHDFLTAHLYWQPLAAALVGLIPNCAASVTLTQLFLNNAITYGSVIAGLSASGGLGLLLLLKENKDKKNTALIIILLVAISTLAGVFLQNFSR